MFCLKIKNYEKETIVFMFDNLGFHLEMLTLISIILLVIGAILGYGSNAISKKFIKNPTEKAALAVKLVGLAFVAAGVIIILTR